MGDGAAGFVVAPRGRPTLVAGFTVRRGEIAEIDILGNPKRPRQLNFTVSET